MMHGCLKGRFGEEYPAAIVMDGARLPLDRESRFSRHYWSPEHKLGVEISRFADGSATISAAELQRRWPTWTEAERLDFCQSCRSLEAQPDFPDMLRFVLQHGGPGQWSAVATLAAACLPREEAFDLLLRALHSIEIGSPSNLVQGIAETGHPGAEVALRAYLRNLWQHPPLWQDAGFINHAAFLAAACIGMLIDLGAPPAEFAEQVRELAAHPCARNRESCRSELARHYPLLVGSA